MIKKHISVLLTLLFCICLSFNLFAYSNEGVGWSGGSKTNLKASSGAVYRKLSKKGDAVLTFNNETANTIRVYLKNNSNTNAKVEIIERRDDKKDRIKKTITIKKNSYQYYDTNVWRNLFWFAAEYDIKFVSGDSINVAVTKFKIDKKGKDEMKKYK